MCNFVGLNVNSIWFCFLLLIFTEFTSYLYKFYIFLFSCDSFLTPSLPLFFSLGDASRIYLFCLWFLYLISFIRLNFLINWSIFKLNFWRNSESHPICNKMIDLTWVWCCTPVKKPLVISCEYSNFIIIIWKFLKRVLFDLMNEGSRTAPQAF